MTTSLNSSTLIAEGGVVFGTSGARGLVVDFTPEVCAAFTHAFVAVMRQEFDVKQMALAIDNRPSSPAMAQARQFKEGKDFKSRMGAHNRDTQMGWFIIIGTLPILIAGLLFKDAIESTLRNLWITVTVLALFGVLLWVVDARSKQVKTMKEMTWKDALIFGIGQMLALIPGVSRSGGTITFGRAMGYTREAAVRVSFLMAIPAVFGAGILEAVSAVKDVAAGNAGMFPGWGATIAATIVAFVVGYVVIIGFLKFVSTFSYKAFAIYRIALAVVVALLLICGVLHPTEVVAAA